APAPAPAKVEPIRRDVFFTINSAKVSANEAAKIKEIAEYLNNNPKANVTVTGVADKGTGTSKINEALASQRANVVADALQKQYNIDASRIKVESNGDRVQPFAQNDKNRVTICVAE
ncbi:MAG: OmpA family protein, partial [Prevotellaceae bacterium]|nr:OmpA family protein [Prevotellaceae bacterium]